MLLDLDALENISEVPGTILMARKFRVGIKTSGDNEWVFNGLRFDSEAEAQRYAEDLSSRWAAVREIMVEEIHA